MAAVMGVFLLDESRKHLRSPKTLWRSPIAAGGLAANSFIADIFSGSTLYPSGVIKRQR